MTESQSKGGVGARLPGRRCGGSVSDTREVLMVVPILLFVASIVLLGSMAWAARSLGVILRRDKSGRLQANQ
jgi:hypothetical protein